MGKYTIFIICLLLFFSRKSFADEAGGQSTGANRGEMTLPAADSLATLAELQMCVDLYYDKPEVINYIEALLEKSIRRDSQEITYKALSELMIYYYSNKNMERLDYWVNRLDSLVDAGAINLDVYFDVHRNKVGFFLRDDLFEDAVNEAMQLYDKALKTDYLYGKICSSDVLGLIYQASGQDSAAILTFQEALKGLEILEGHPDYRTRILSYLIELNLSQGNYPETEMLLDKYRLLLDMRDEENRKNGITNQGVNKYRWLQYSFSADLYLRMNRMDMAKKALDVAASFYQKGEFVRKDFSSYYYLYVNACYYVQTKEYDTALEILDKDLDSENKAEVIDLKIKIYCATERFKEALPLYDKLFFIMKRDNDESLIRQVNSLRVLYDVNEQKQREAELQINNIKIAEKQRISVYIFIASGVLFVFLVVLFRYLWRLRRYKNELVRERNALIISRENLDQEKKKAEMANQMKDAFIANISHEIRTPLNAIVGFSSLLSEPDVVEEEKPEFVALISKNTELLLALVNDVLDLSRIEAGNFQILVEPCDVIGCCREALSNVRHKLAHGVELRFTSGVTTFTVPVASVQLSLLLSKLLDNAVKFTTEGEIELLFEVEEGQHLLRFTVTDTGIGIPVNKQDAVFERFEKLDLFSQGTGLGLAICKALAELLGGTIRIESDYTSGARFIFTCPYVEAVV